VTTKRKTVGTDKVDSGEKQALQGRIWWTRISAQCYGEKFVDIKFLS
jgi:hypothetical protein